MNPIHKRLDADFERVMREEASDGICCEPGDCFVCDEDREPSPVVSIFEEIPMPRDPYGCENPVSSDEE
jgi:hypothetical protein